ncbi:MAG: hypothetical protein AB1668_01575 [Nanoarchaeota archaeon]
MINPLNMLRDYIDNLVDALSSGTADYAAHKGMILDAAYEGIPESMSRTCSDTLAERLRNAPRITDEVGLRHLYTASASGLSFKEWKEHYRTCGY